MAEQLNDRAGSGLVDKLMQYLPARFRPGTAVGPGVRVWRVSPAGKPLRIERRLYTAGSHKAMLDPFLPENPDDVAKLKTLQREIHQIFIALVKESRGARLKGADDSLFTGEYWAGESSIALGLADGI